MKQFAKQAIKRSLGLVGLDMHRILPRGDRLESMDGNLVVPNIWQYPVFKDLIPFRFGAGSDEVVLLGSPEEIEFLRPGLAEHGLKVTGIVWDWEAGTAIGEIPDGAQIVVCKLPLNEHQWRTIKQLKELYGSRVLGIQELVLPFTTLVEGQLSFEYNLRPIAGITPFYVGQNYFGPLDKLDAAFPISGKRVIEFGPMEGAQTAGLVHLGAQSVTCIEARAVGFIKTMIACYCFGWDNVKIIMDDFHNADRQKYGTFDLAFAHGVYYHSFAPFLFFENLMSLSDNIFIGGYCTVDNPPPGTVVINYAPENLEYEGKTYKVGRIQIGNSYNNAVNLHAYHFRRNDLLDFFADRGYEVTIVKDEAVYEPWGTWYLSFVARKKPVSGE